MKKQLLGFTMALIMQNNVNAEINTHNFQAYNKSSENRQLKYITFGNADKPPTHNNNTVEWFYNSRNQSSSIFSEDDVIETIKRSMRTWSDVSDINFIYKGKTANNINNTNDGIITIGYWSEAAFTDLYGNFGGHTQIEWSDFKITEGYMTLNAGDINSGSSPQTLNHLQGLITHEVGHLLALDHSNIEASIMYADPYHSYEYQSVLRDDDIAIAKLLYPENISNPLTTVKQNLDIVIQSATLNSPDGTSNIWAILEYKGVDADGDIIWKLGNYGSN